MQGITNTTENTRIDPFAVSGWGVDSDTENDPTYPMRKRSLDDHQGYDWVRPEQQTSGEEILQSTERPNLSATFGTSAPPAGLSGLIRREAFKFSENSYGHWLPLMLADRIDMVEGVIGDLARGHVPNIFEELGWKAEWKHNRVGLVTKIAVGAALGYGIFTLLKGTRQTDSR